MNLPYQMDSRICPTNANSEQVKVDENVAYFRSNSAKYELTSKENLVVEILKEYGITDINAISTFLGNIRAESNFNPSAYNTSEDALGLMQWRLGRKARLEAFCGLENTSNFDCQLSYIFTEPDWQNIEPKYQVQGQPMSYYQGLLRDYLRYGTEGNRRGYSQQYREALK
ncbi:MAG: lytic transglycosylase domain-containing protein [Synechococcus sp. SB0672_bin_6]|nr:lytic transglycosylase domain-containing protein [Synechococcus sp. SB0672_bin_6]